MAFRRRNSFKSAARRGAEFASAIIGKYAARVFHSARYGNTSAFRRPTEFKYSSWAHKRRATGTSSGE